MPALTGKKRKLIFLLTSPEIWALWGQRLQASLPREPLVLFLPPGERHKRMSQVERLATEMAKAGADRSSLLIAFGGGVIGDMGGFLSAIYMRGIDYIQVPTTLLSQVDSSVGGKTGVNLQTGKNLVGCFYPPQEVVADIDCCTPFLSGSYAPGFTKASRPGSSGMRRSSASSRAIASTSTRAILLRWRRWSRLPSGSRPRWSVWTSGSTVCA